MKQMGPSVEPGVKSPFSTLWAVHIEKPYGQWCVAQRNAIWSLTEDDTPMEKLGLDPSKTYLGYDFWEQKFIGEVKDSLHWDNLPYGRTKVIALREKLAIPQLIGSTRHVSMDAVSVKNIEWKDKELTLSLDCVENVSETYSFFVPEGYGLGKVECEGGEAKSREIGSDGLLEIEVTAEEKNVTLRLKFE